MALTNGYISMFLFDNEDKPFIPEDKCYKLKHDTEYKICIVNHHPTLRADATVNVDGKKVGEFRVNNKSKITIERPVHAARKLTFYAINSDKGAMAALSSSNPELGNIEVKVQMEKKRVRFIMTDGPESDDGEDECDCGSRLGGTGLGVSSQQKFVSAPDIRLDDEVIIIKTKLVLLKEPVVIPL